MQISLSLFIHSSNMTLTCLIIETSSWRWSSVSTSYCFATSSSKKHRWYSEPFSSHHCPNNAFPMGCCSTIYSYLTSVKSHSLKLILMFFWTVYLVCWSSPDIEIYGGTEGFSSIFYFYPYYYQIHLQRFQLLTGQNLSKKPLLQRADLPSLAFK